MYQSVREAKVGEVYFNLYQLIIIYNLKSNLQKRGKMLSVKTIDMMVEIIRLIDLNLKVCFPQMDRAGFEETFQTILQINYA